MIRLYDGYVILIDDYQYTLAKDTGRTDKRNGRTIYDTVGYFSTLKSALIEFKRVNVRNRVKSGSHALRDALHAIIEENERLEKFIRENIPDV